MGVQMSPVYDTEFSRSKHKDGIPGSNSIHVQFFMKTQSDFYNGCVKFIITLSVKIALH